MPILWVLWSKTLMLDTGQRGVMANSQRLGAYPTLWAWKYVHGVGYKAGNVVSRPVGVTLGESDDMKKGGMAGGVHVHLLGLIDDLSRYA